VLRAFDGISTVERSIGELVIEPITPEKLERALVWEPRLRDRDLRFGKA
jgi:hypothetical protein